ncbi:hypothetical protein ABZ570_24595 [Micromonospora sp. NPDC007271]|uniref:hypothetical protein n=1 Tax=Micromonospora sp. NPDC007271 TaxID=3154587 RepID=UPI0033E5F215
MKKISCLTFDAGRRGKFGGEKVQQMTEAKLTCGGFEVLCYEPEGLFLTVGLLPVEVSGTREHLLVHQLSYLGSGEISVQVGFEQRARPASTAPAFVTVDLLGVARGRMPSHWVTSMPVREGLVDTRLVVWGEPSPEDALRGELVAKVRGHMPVLTASSRASVTQADMTWPTDVEALPATCRIPAPRTEWTGSPDVGLDRQGVSW